MSKYYAKYLAVEDGFKRIVKNEQGFPVDYEQEVKLFLVTNDIQVGDEVLDTYSGMKLIVTKSNSGSNASDYYIKVIGEISKDAIWVKDGDEFTKEQIQIVNTKVIECLCEAPGIDWWVNSNGCKHEDEDNYNRAYCCTRKVDKFPYVKVKCDKCNTYH